MDTEETPGKRAPFIISRKDPALNRSVEGHHMTEFGHTEAQHEEQTVLLVFETQSSPGWSWTLGPLASASTCVGGGGDYRACFLM